MTKVTATGERWLWWLKRDLRLHDNEALRYLVDNDHQCLALFVFEPSLGRAPETSAFHALALGGALEDLKVNIKARGGRLAVASGEVVEVLDTLYQEAPFAGIVSHEETGTHITFERDKAVARWARQRGVQWREFMQNGVVRALSSRDERQKIIAKRLWDTPLFRAPRKIVPWSDDKATDQAPTDRVPDRQQLLQWSEENVMPLNLATGSDLEDGVQRVSETAARAELNDFLKERGRRYSGGISSPNSAFTAGSRLSTHLAWGTLSLRTAFHRSTDRMAQLRTETSAGNAQWQKSLRAFQSRLHWHDHFMQRLESEPGMEFSALNPAYADIEYLPAGDEQQRRLEAWRCGRTGIPLLDACMRCLMATGFLNFRMRAMLVTTACFGLQIHWRDLLHPLAQVFADYEPGIHISQIQMQAGVVGINTLRVYSPHKQLLDQDPQADFVRRWVPELSSFDAERIAQYENIALGDYVRPITDIKANAKLIKDQLYAIRKSAEGQVAAQATLQQHGSRLPAKHRLGGSARGRASSKSKTKKTKVNGAQMSFDW